MLMRRVERGGDEFAPTVAADRGYDVVDFIAQVQQCNIVPHVAAKTRDSAVPEHIKATDEYAVSLRRRKMIEEAFGWVKEIGTLGRIKLRGLEKIRAHALLNFAAYNLTRINNLVAGRWSLAASHFRLDGRTACDDLKAIPELHGSNLSIDAGQAVLIKRIDPRSVSSHSKADDVRGFFKGRLLK